MIQNGTNRHETKNIVEQDDTERYLGELDGISWYIIIVKPYMVDYPFISTVSYVVNGRVQLKMRTMVPFYLLLTITYHGHIIDTTSDDGQDALSPDEMRNPG